MFSNTYDVAICGGGLAGLTLARQLKLKIPDISIVVLDRLTRPLPEAAFKVGESTVYDGAYYLDHVLQLEDYFEEHHFPKLGLRYFFGNTQGLLHERSEFGLSELAPSIKSYQIDRGKLENDLRRFNEEVGIELLENCLIKDIQLAAHPEVPHQIVYTQGENKNTGTIQCRWVIDAMGRRRFLQKKLGIAQPNNPRYSAAWFRVKGRLDVSDFVPRTEKQWHDRVPNNNRYYSTNHLCAEGYWVWLIPLSTGHTSIGIVANEEVHPFDSYHTYERAYEWLEKHEPVLAYHLKGQQPIDFMKLPRYSYSSTQVFSINRWACVGISGVFADPFYSPGTDMIGYGNSLVAQMIELDLRGKLTQERVDEANRFFLTLNDSTTKFIHNTCSCFGNDVVTAMKLLWDFPSTLVFIQPLMMNAIFLDGEKLSWFWGGAAGQAIQLSDRMEELFSDWLAKSQRRLSFEFIDYWKIPHLKELRSLNMRPNKTDRELFDDALTSLELLEEWAQALFLFAVADTMPEMLGKFKAPVWLNAWAISLDASKWEQDGLFAPKSKPRELRRAIESLQNIFQTPEPILPEFEVSLLGSSGSR